MRKTIVGLQLLLLTPGRYACRSGAERLQREPDELELKVAGQQQADFGE